MDGYKVFNKGLINTYGVKYEENKVYKLDTSNKKLKFGNHGYGFHFVKRLEDGLRYFDGMNEEIEIAKVKSLGNIVEAFDDYNEYYELYVTDKIYIEHVLTREEILEYAITLSSCGLERFVKGYKLTENEIDLIINKASNSDINKAIMYYQKNEKDVYSKVLKK